MTAGQAWEMAGLAIMDGYKADAARWTKVARELQEQERGMEMVTAISGRRVPARLERRTMKMNDEAKQLKRSKIRAFVYAGAAFLDAKIGTEWRKKIDLERLNLESCISCILGQTFGEFKKGEDELDIHGDAVACFGFERPSIIKDPSRDDPSWDECDEEYKMLTEEWKELLSKSLPKSKRRS